MAEETPNPVPSSSPSEEVMWKRILTEVRREITREKREDDDDFDDEANAIAIGIIVLGLLIGAFFLIRPLFRDKPIDPVYTKLEAIKRIQELTLVKQHYNALIPVTKKDSRNNDLEFLLRAPVQVYGNLDLSQVHFDLRPDSLIVVSLPPPKIDEPYLDIQETEVFTVGRNLFKKMFQRLFQDNTKYVDAYDQIRIALDSANYHVYRRALKNDIEEETLDQAELYLRSLIGSLGYRVEFERPFNNLPIPRDSSSWEQFRQQLQTLDLSPEDWQRQARSSLFRLRFSN